MKTKPHTRSILTTTKRSTVITLAACLALVVSSCATTAPGTARADSIDAQQAAEPAPSKRPSAPPVRNPNYGGAVDADAALRAVTVPLRAAGWVLGNFLDFIKR